jgi:hypothetical protein
MHRILAIGAVAVLALALVGAASAWSWPADGAVLRPFALGPDVYAGGQHRGIDIAGPAGSAVKAPAAGVVSFAGSLPTYGRGVTILTADGYAVTLVHLGTIEVAKGTTVGEGDTVGTIGVSGTPEQDEPSVHLGIRQAAEEEGYVDPLGLLPPRAAPSPAPTPTPEAVTAPAAVSAPVAVRPPSPPPTSPAPAAAPVPTPSPATGAPSSSAQPAPTATSEPLSSSPATSPQSVDSSPGAPVRRETPEAGVTIAGASPPPVRAVTADTARSTPVSRPVTFRVDAPALRSDAASRHVAPRETAVPAVSAVRADPAVASARRLVREAASPAEVGRAVAHEESRVAGVRGPVHEPAAESVPRTRRVPLRSAVRPAAEGRSAVLASGSSPSPPTTRRAVEARRDAPFAVGGLGVRALAAGIALLALLAAATGRRVARRIGMDGAVLPHHTDLLRQLDAAHRARLHDRGGGRLRSSSATART